eukprot:CAMPEP_0184126946 /NCGR_PEP_ID=MMETSP0974-20121125/25818_1 /TAXON_ID=483370 /ORGANISM="non described non described, Strain CCMP2097" /LENGTH=69 /DNA_ID=CAMNT_0026430337 /DNA_START=26 /DNA_END=236 /DNA_ORIENTATION=-
MTEAWTQTADLRMSKYRLRTGHMCHSETNKTAAFAQTENCLATGSALRAAGEGSRRTKFAAFPNGPDGR